MGDGRWCWYTSNHQDRFQMDLNRWPLIVAFFRSSVPSHLSFLKTFQTWPRPNLPSLPVEGLAGLLPRSLHRRRSQSEDGLLPRGEWSLCTRGWRWWLNIELWIFLNITKYLHNILYFPWKCTILYKSLHTDIFMNFPFPCQNFYLS